GRPEENPMTAQIAILRQSVGCRGGAASSARAEVVSVCAPGTSTVFAPIVTAIESVSCVPRLSTGGSYTAPTVRPAGPRRFPVQQTRRQRFAPHVFQYVISRLAILFAGLKSSPEKYATGSSAACVISAGMPRIAAASDSYMR